MGTNVYAYIKNIYDENGVFEKYELLAKNHDIDGIRSLNEQLLAMEDENKVHIGKRSGGWKFLFNHNNWKYYDYTEESINRFLESCYEIRNEYNEVISVQDFWKEYVDDFSNGFSGEDYAKYEIDRAMKKVKGEIDDPYNFILSLDVAKREYNYAKDNNWYEAKYYEWRDNDGFIRRDIIPYDKLSYRFSNNTSFC